MKKKKGKIILAVVVGIFLFIQLYPVVWLFMASIKPSVELATEPFALPQNPTFVNYIDIFNEGSIFRYMWNSVKVTVTSILLILVLSSTAGLHLQNLISVFLNRFTHFSLLVL